MARRTELRAHVRAELGVDPDELLFLTVANLRPEKGYQVLLDAARTIADRGLPIRIAAVGQGPLNTTLHARHVELALGDRFQFLGQRDDVLELLAGVDAFVLPSLHEGLPVTLMEATSVGLPIVASSVGGIPQILRRRGRRTPRAAGRPGRPGRGHGAAGVGSGLKGTSGPAGQAPELDVRHRRGQPDPG